MEGMIISKTIFCHENRTKMQIYDVNMTQVLYNNYKHPKWGFYWKNRRKQEKKIWRV